VGGGGGGVLHPVTASSIPTMIVPAGTSCGTLKRRGRRFH